MGDGGFTIGSIPGWTVTATTGVFDPTTTQLSPPTDGIQVGYLNAAQDIAQVLGATLTANTFYTLSADFLARKDCCAWPTQGGEMDLMAGSTVLSSTTLLTLAGGGIQGVTVTYNALPADPNLGQSLQIRFRNLGTSGQGQVDVDNVKLDGTATALPGVPEPSSVLLCVSGLLVAAWRRKSRR